MLLVSYDISNDILRARFSKYLEKCGMRLQCSVFQIRNSSTFLNNITCDIENKFKKRFEESDSVLIFVLTDSCKVIKYGHSAHDDTDCLFVMQFANPQSYFFSLRKEPFHLLTLRLDCLTFKRVYCSIHQFSLASYFLQGFPSLIEFLLLQMTGWIPMVILFPSLIEFLLLQIWQGCLRVAEFPSLIEFLLLQIQHGQRRLVQLSFPSLIEFLLLQIG